MRRTLPILLALALLGACGGGDADVATDAQADAKADEAAGKDVDTEFSGRGGKDFCGYLKDVIEEDRLAVSANASKEEQQKNAKETLDVYDALQEKAPGEIKADVMTVIGGARPYYVATAEGRQPTEAEMKAIEGNKSEHDAAEARVEAYAEKVCGIKDETATTTPPADDGGGTSGDEQAPAEEDPAREE